MISVYSHLYNVRSDVSAHTAYIGQAKLWSDFGIPLTNAIDNRVRRNIWLELYDIVYRDNA